MAWLPRPGIHRHEITSGRPLIAEQDPSLDRDFLVQALRDGIIYRTRLAADPCEACLTHPALLCTDCQAVLDLASVYRMLASQLLAGGA